MSCSLYQQFKYRFNFVKSMIEIEMATRTAGINLYFLYSSWRYLLDVRDTCAGLTSLVWFVENMHRSFVTINVPNTWYFGKLVQKWKVLLFCNSLNEFCCDHTIKSVSERSGQPMLLAARRLILRDLVEALSLSHSSVVSILDNH